MTLQQDSRLSPSVTARARSSARALAVSDTERARARGCMHACSSFSTTVPPLSQPGAPFLYSLATMSHTAHTLLSSTELLAAAQHHAVHNYMHARMHLQGQVIDAQKGAYRAGFTIFSVDITDYSPDNLSDARVVNSVVEWLRDSGFSVVRACIRCCAGSSAMRIGLVCRPMEGVRPGAKQFPMPAAHADPSNFGPQEPQAVERPWDAAAEAAAQKRREAEDALVASFLSPYCEDDYVEPLQL